MKWLADSTSWANQESVSDHDTDLATYPDCHLRIREHIWVIIDVSLTLQLPKNEYKIKTIWRHISTDVLRIDLANILRVLVGI